jgi:beta-lactamase regulating signal transducer with metallopeptidase domain
MSFEAFTERIGWVILHSLWMLTAIAVVGLSCIRALSTPASRYTTLCVTLLLMFVVPIAAFFCFASAELDHDFTPRLAGALDQTQQSETRPNQDDGADDLVPRLLNSQSTESDGSISTSQDTNARQASIATNNWTSDITRWLGPVWLVGVCFFSVWNVGGYVWLNRRIRCSHAVVGDSHKLFMDCLGRLEIRHTVAIRQADFVRSACIFGWFRPVVLVPINVLTGMPTEQLRAILLHELAHIRRYDGLVNWLQSVVETVLFFHPLVWFVSRRLREEREHCADEIAALALGDRINYAKAITAAAQLAHTSALASRKLEYNNLVAATGGLLKRRIERLLQVEHPMERHRNGWGWLVVLAVAAVSVAAQSFRDDGVTEAQDAAIGVADALDGPTDETQDPKKDQREPKDKTKANNNSDEDKSPSKTKTSDAGKAKPKKDKKAKAASLDKKSQESLEKITANAVKYILSQSQENGTFETNESHQRGASALAGLALLKSGVSKKDKAIEQVKKLLDSSDPKWIYGASLELLFRLELGVKNGQKAMATKLAQLIVDSAVQEGANKGMWSYRPGKSANKGGDHSNTSFALWALTEASRAGIEVVDSVFTNAVDHLLAAQRADGGWCYTDKHGNSTGSMTCGCLASLLASSEAADDYRKKEVKQARKRGLTWLNRRFMISTNPGAGAFLDYYLMQLRRASNESKVSLLGNSPILPTGIRFLATSQSKNGSWASRAGGMSPVISTSMLLLFLNNEPPAKEKKK